MDDFSIGDRCAACGCEDVYTIYEDGDNVVFIKERMHRNGSTIFDITFRDGDYHAVSFAAWLPEIKEIIEVLSKFVAKMEKKEFENEKLKLSSSASTSAG